MKSRFIMPDPAVCESFGMPAMVILADLEYWNQNYDDLVAWCQDHDARVQGMTVEFPSLELLTAFALRWA